MGFKESLIEALGDGDANQSEISVILRRCFFADLPSGPIRFWEGPGKLFTSDGNEWIGLVDAAGSLVANFPAVSDGRDGSSPKYEVVFPYLDQETYDAAEADPTVVDGHELIYYYVYVKLGEGLRPDTPIHLHRRFTMVSSNTDESATLDGTSIVNNRSFTVVFKDDNQGRSFSPNRTHTDAGQRNHAITLGVTIEDKSHEFVASQANKTYKRP